MMKLQFR